MYRLQKLLFLGLSLFIIAGTAGPLAAEAVEEAPAKPKPVRLKPGDLATDFTVIGPLGEEVRLSDYRGKVVVLDFWATWCAPCLIAMPHYNRLAEAHSGDGLVVLAVSVADTRENYDGWVKENTTMLALQTAHDPLGRNLRESVFSTSYGVSLLPSVFVVDREGLLVGRVRGSGETSNLQELLDQAGLTTTEEQEAVAPPFRETYGRTVAGQTLPDMPLQNVDGSAVRLADLAANGPLVLRMISVGNFNLDGIGLLNTWAIRYADQGVRVVALAAYGTREQFDLWFAEFGNQLRFPVVFDPAGPPPVPDKPREDMTDEEIDAFNVLRREHYTKVAPMVFAGGMMAPVPHTLVVDSSLHLIGVYFGTDAATREALGNLLLRGGVSLVPADLPLRVLSTEETVPKPVEADVALLQPGQPAPDFSALTIDGTEVKPSDYRGKVVVLDFWATWCGPCMIAMPHLQKVATDYREQGVVVLGSATRDTREAFERWIRVNGETYPDIVWAHDPAGRGNARASRALFGVSGIPTQFIIGRDGIIADVIIGYLPGEVLLEAGLAKAGIDVSEEVLLKAEENRRHRRRL